MADVAAKNLFNCCVKSAIDFSQANPDKLVDGVVIRCIHCKGGWMMLDGQDKLNQIWNWCSNHWFGIEPLNKKQLVTPLVKDEPVEETPTEPTVSP